MRAFVAAVAVLGPLAPVVAAHSQLVSSTPGSGEVVATPPSEIVLVFSEPIDASHTSLDLLDSAGRAIATGIGSRDPSGPNTLDAAVPALGQGTYTVDWRALSAADGHSTSGSFSFGVGDVDAGALPIDVGAGGGDLHAGHDAGQILVEVQGRTLSDAGFMLAFGLLVVALAVLAPAGGLGSGPVRAQVVALLVAAAAAIVLGLSAGSAPGLDPVGYLLASRSGGLLVDRAVVGLVGATAAAVLLRVGRPRAALVVAGIAGVAGIVLIAFGGHPAGTGNVGPIADLLVHLGAASIWIAGVAALAGLVAADASNARRLLPAVVPRFSALALVSVALVAGTGVYLAWLETGDLTTIDSQYAVALLAKVGLVGVALVLGALNLVGRGSLERRLGGFGPRIGLEVLVLAGVLVATANLASGSPPGPERPVPLEPAVAANRSPVAADLAVEPGRPGPNAWWVTVPSGATVASVDLRLDRLDVLGAENVVHLRPVPTEPGKWIATGGLLPADTRWEATVVLTSANGEIGRTSFAFDVDGSGIAAGRAGLPIDPALALAAALAIAAVVGLSFALAGGALPGVERLAGRRALLGGGVAGAALAIALVIGTMAR